MSARRWAYIAGAALFFMAADSAQAQVFLGRRPGGIVVQAPYAPRVSVGVGLGIAPVRPYLLPRRRLLGELAYGTAPIVQPPAPGVAPPGAPGAYASPARPAAPAYSAASSALPSDAALRAMNDSELLNAAVSVTRQLDDDLARFDTGAQWRSFLQLPADALPPPTGNQVTLGLASLDQTLRRFDKIAGDSGYGMISELESFDASRSALAEVVRRFGARRSTGAPAASPVAEPGAVEELPMPSTVTSPAPRAVMPAAFDAPAAADSTLSPSEAPDLLAPANAPSAEQSILVK
jgi:hypothetical protein